jgi:hypothetical protein
LPSCRSVRSAASSGPTGSAPGTPRFSSR